MNTGTPIVVVTVWIDPAEEDSKVVVKVGQVIVSVNPSGNGGRTKMQGGSHGIDGLLEVQIEGLTETIELDPFPPMPLSPV